jgi:hypothetical protein
MSRIGLDVSSLVFSKSSWNLRFRTSFLVFSASTDAANFFSRSSSPPRALIGIDLAELARRLGRLVSDHGLELRVNLEPGVAAGTEQVEVHGNSLFRCGQQREGAEDRILR